MLSCALMQDKRCRNEVLGRNPKFTHVKCKLFQSSPLRCTSQLPAFVFFQENGWVNNQVCAAQITFSVRFEPLQMHLLLAHGLWFLLVNAALLPLSD